MELHLHSLCLHGGHSGDFTLIIVIIIAHGHLLPRFRINGTIPLLPVYTFTVCRGAFTFIIINHYYKQGYTNSERQVAWAKKFYKVVPNICGSSAWNLLYFTLLAPKILRWLLDFWKLCAPLIIGINSITISPPTLHA
jgi:hypothetical protein